MEIGIQTIPISELYNFPNDKLPREDSEYFVFIIGDRPGKTNTSYLTDYLNYEPEADIGFPINGKDRLTSLIDLFLMIIQELSPSRFVVVITESSQIDEIKNINVKDLSSEIHKDFELFDGPPYCLYDIAIE